MTPKQLSVLTRKELVEIARSHQVTGWHGMRKQQLVDAVSKIKAPKSKTRRAAAKLSNGRPPRMRSEKSPNGNSPRPRAIRRGPRASALMFRSNQQQHDKVVSQVIDSDWLQVEWSFCQNTLDRAHAALGIEWHEATPCIRVFDVTGDEQEIEIKRRVDQVTISGHSNRWYIPIPQADREYKLQIGLATPGNRFFVLAQTRKIRVPRGSVHSTSRPAHDGWPTASFDDHTGRPVQQLESPVTARPVTAGSAVDGQVTPSFLFKVDAELVVSGAVASGSQLSILDEQVQLAADGSFAIRIPLPEGRQVLPAVAVSPDGTEKRTILLALERNTKELEPQIHNRYAD